MKNITISLPDDLARKAKVFAAEQDTSVSKYVGGLLAERLEAEQGYRNAMARWQERTPMVLNESRSKYPGRDDVHER
ncbi:MAG: CopG family transcriptional regulator [Kiritimatiellia bacterium]